MLICTVLCISHQEQWWWFFCIVLYVSVRPSLLVMFVISGRKDRKYRACQNTNTPKGVHMFLFSNGLSRDVFSWKFVEHYMTGNQIYLYMCKNFLCNTFIMFPLLHNNHFCKNVGLFYVFRPCWRGLFRRFTGTYILYLYDNCTCSYGWWSNWKWVICQVHRKVSVSRRYGKGTRIRTSAFRRSDWPVFFLNLPI